MTDPATVEKVARAIFRNRARYQKWTPEEAKRAEDKFWNADPEDEISDALAALAAHEAAIKDAGMVVVPKEPFQARVAPWMATTFTPEICADEVERGDRLLEETLELLQARGYDPARVGALRDYVWGRPVGETAQEVGGVMICLAALCLAVGVDMHEAGETELARIWTKVEQIRAKQAAKPTGSALPIAMIAASEALPAPPESETK